MVRKIILAAVTALAAIIVVAAVRQYAVSRNQITGGQWYAMQEEYITQFETFSDDIDSITALYLNGDLDQEAFLSHMELFDKELDAMQAAYEQAEEETPVRTGTHTYYTKMGCDAVESCYGMPQALPAASWPPGTGSISHMRETPGSMSCGKGNCAR